MNTHILTCRDAKQKDLVEYLASLEHQPQKVRGNDYWYLSPLRQEKTPSFKVNRKFNVWYDHGMGKGGNLVDFGILYHRCSVQELLQKLNGNSSFQQQNPSLQDSPSSLKAEPTDQSQKKSEDQKSGISILSTHEVSSYSLVKYLQARGIASEISDRYCQEIRYKIGDKIFYALGFKNNSGGYELRNENFKGSNSPKDTSFFDLGSQQVAVFEGFFSFMSFQTIHQQRQEQLTNFLVLNSLAFFEKSRPLMERHGQIDLFLDRDEAGIIHTGKALEWGTKYIDRSDFYAGHKDLNEWLKAQHIEQKQSQRIGRRF